MNQHFGWRRLAGRLAGFILLLSLALGTQPALARALEPAPVALPVVGPGWHKITVDTGPNVGQSLSLAIHPINQQPYISYLDGANGDLKLAFPAAAGGDCGPGNTWSCNSLHFTNNEIFGLFSSIDFDKAGNWGISYMHSYPLTAVSFEGTPANGNTQFFTSVKSGYSAYVGTSLHFTPDGRASFAFQGMDTNIKNYVNYAVYNPSGLSTCGTANHWDCETIAQSSTAGLAGYPALAYLGGLAMIAYRDAQYGQPYFATRVGFGGTNCPYSSLWSCNLVDRDSVVSGGLAFAVFDMTNSAMAYYDSYSHYVVVATAKTGVCGWTCNYLENVGAQANDNQTIALIYRRNGTPVIAYTDRKTAHHPLKIAYPMSGGNCGTIVDGKRTWWCEVVDDGGTKDVGNFVALAESASGMLYIAYSNDTDQTLQLAYRNNQAFIPVVRR